MSNFAKAQLLKYGWTEGKGLGKNEDGIAEALKPKLKFDTTGVGHDASEYQWWEFVYNKASKNLTIDIDSQDVKVNVKDKDAVDIKTTKSELNWEKIKKEQDLHYGSFIKTSTLENGRMTKGPEYKDCELENQGDEFQLSVLNDEELFKACGGRTAHKGARHGLKLNGKLARIERQEQEILARMNKSRQSEDWILVDSKRKKKKKTCSENMDIEEKEEKSYKYVSEVKTSEHVVIPNNANVLIDEDPPKQPKKTRRKNRRRIEDLTHKLQTSVSLLENVAENNVNSSEKSEKKRKRKKKYCDIINDEKVKTNNNIEITEEVDETIEPTVKKHKSDILDPSVLNYKIEKRKKNKKSKKERERIEKLSTSLKTLDLVERAPMDEPDDENKNTPPKKKKKKSKN